MIAVAMSTFATEMSRKQLAQYASSLQGKKKAELKAAIYALTSPTSVLDYGSGAGSTWSGFYKTDRYDDGKCRDRYSNDIRYFTTQTSAISGMNIEHSFPKSWWGGSENNAYKDLFNLMPCEAKINSSKSNYGMGKVTAAATDNGCTKVGSGKAGTTNANLWEPADKWKGDFSRGYMYMATAHQNLCNQYTSEGLKSLEKNTWPTLQTWAYTLYLEWIREDRVDQIEVDRNNAVYDIQKNRNLFVDFPQLAEYVWGDSIDVAFDPTSSLTSAYDDPRYEKYLAGEEWRDAEDTRAVLSLVIGGSATKTTYSVGDAFDYTGLTVTANYDDGTTGVVTSRVEWTVDNDLQTIGTFNVTVTATYKEKTTKKTYGITVVEYTDLKEIPYEEELMNTQGDFTIRNAEGTDLDVWQASSWGMKATAYANNKKNAAESWLISPMINGKGWCDIRVAFEHTGKFFGTMENEATLWVKVSGEEWQQVEIPNYMTGDDYDFVANDIDISGLVDGKLFQVGFRYKSTTNAAPTWEVKNFFVSGETDGIESVTTDANENEDVFNLAGQKVGDSYKGVVIKKGRKILR